MSEDKPELKEETKLSVEEFAKLFKEESPADLYPHLARHVEMLDPAGWFVGECQVLDSSSLGSTTVLPYGGRAAYQEPPVGVYSPRGLASDTSVVKGVLSRETYDAWLDSQETNNVPE